MRNETKNFSTIANNVLAPLAIEQNFIKMLAKKIFSKSTNLYQMGELLRQEIDNVLTYLSVTSIISNRKFVEELRIRMV